MLQIIFIDHPFCLKMDGDLIMLGDCNQPFEYKRTSGIDFTQFDWMKTLDKFAFPLDYVHNSLSFWQVLLINNC